MWVGLSAVKVDCTIKETPLSDTTNTGKLIAQIEKNTSMVDFYKTNLVKCLPIKDEKIRYPKKDEMETCYNRHLEGEITEFKPKVVFLLGKQVSDFVSDDEVKFSKSFSYKPFTMHGTTFVPVHHPSYVLVYKRKKVDSYIKSVSSLIAKYASSPA